MGTNSSEQGFEDAKPIHAVAIKTFYPTFRGSYHYTVVVTAFLV